jgi:hypothetical protein
MRVQAVGLAVALNPCFRGDEPVTHNLPIVKRAVQSFAGVGLIVHGALMLLGRMGLDQNAGGLGWVGRPTRGAGLGHDEWLWWRGKSVHAVELLGHNFQWDPATLGHTQLASLGN